jgi:hypothetical protein
MKKMTVILVCTVLASAANATILGTVNLQDHNNSLSDQGQLWGGGLTGATYYTGIYSWTNAGGTDLGTQVPGWGFCIELVQGPYVGWQDILPLNEAPLPSQYGTPMGTTKANYVRELWGRYFDPAWTTVAGDKQMAEAFSVCVWEIVYETDATLDVTSGAGFHAAGIEQTAAANAWLASLNGDTAYFAENLVATSTPNGQDYLVQAPEPATMLLLGIGGLLCRKFRKA